MIQMVLMALHVHVYKSVVNMDMESHFEYSSVAVCITNYWYLLCTCKYALHTCMLNHSAYISHMCG